MGPRILVCVVAWGLLALPSPAWTQAGPPGSAEPGLPPQYPEAGPPAPGSKPSPVVSTDAEAEGSTSVFSLMAPMTARQVMRPKGSESVRFGMHFRIAPIRAIAQRELDRLANDNPELETIIEYADQIDLDRVASASNDELRELFLDIEGLSDAEQSAIQGADFSAARPVLVTLLEVAQDPEDATAFAMVPYFGVHLDRFSATLRVPLAGFDTGSGARFHAGNVAVDLQVGHHFLDGQQMGLTWGVSVFLPSASERAGTLALTNALDTPLFAHRYLGFEAFAVWGIDLRYFAATVDFGMSTLAGVKEGIGPDSSQYLRYGISVMVSPGAVASLMAELTGGIPLRDAGVFDTHLFTTGLRFEILVVDLSLGVQLPFAFGDRTTYGFYGGLPFGSPAEINVLTQLDVAF